MIHEHHTAIQLDEKLALIDSVFHTNTVSLIGSLLYGVNGQGRVNDLRVTLMSLHKQDAIKFI